MRNDVAREMRDYARTYRRYILLSAAASFLCFGMLVFCGNIRIDTEELINEPGATMGWLTIGRFGLALLKSMLGLRVHHVFWSGLLFFVFFLTGANFLAFSIYHFGGRREEYPYGAFLLLYVTSNIWCYQIYFSLQQAEIACAMLLTSIAAFLAMRACFEVQGAGRGVRLLISCVLLVIGLGSYQALASYYIAICLSCFLMLALREESEMKRIPTGVVMLSAQFLVSYGVYRWIAGTWFMSTSGYMEDQRGWGRLSVPDCVKNVLRTAKNYLVGDGPRNFSFYAAGVLAALLLCVLLCREKKRGTPCWQGTRLVWCLLSLAGLTASPVLMTLYMGEMLVARSQFALPVAAAALGMCGLGVLRELAQRRAGTAWRRATAIFGICAAVTVVWQTGYDLRLFHTDQMRSLADEEKAELLVTELTHANGGELPELPVVFVGYQSVPLKGIDRRTEMYGWSFFEWDYSRENPTGATHRIAGLVQAHTGVALQELAEEELREEAVERAASMPVFPEEGSVQVTEKYVVVRLSEVQDRAAQDWW